MSKLDLNELDLLLARVPVVLAASEAERVTWQAILDKAKARKESLKKA